MARLPYALTLWTYLQRSESQLFESWLRESDRIDEAHMITLGAIYGTGPIISRQQALQGRLHAPVTGETREEMERRADDLWAQHEKGLSKRPVS